MKSTKLKILTIGTEPDKVLSSEVKLVTRLASCKITGHHILYPQIFH